MSSCNKAYGIYTGKAKVKYSEVRKRKDKIVKSFRKSVRNSLESNENIKLILGTASFNDKNEVKVKVKNGNIQRLMSQYIFINTGVRAAIPLITGLENIDYLTSETIMDQKKSLIIWLF